MVHVANGCYVSAAAYIARFTAAYPAERSEPAAVVLPNADGSSKPHTVAIVSWHGAWWARDEYYGTVDLRSPSARPWDPVTVTRRLERAFRHRAAGQPPRQPDRVPDGADPQEWRLGQIEAARMLLPVDGRIIWLRSGFEDLPFLFFRRAGEGGFAVYDPGFGTVQAVSRVSEPDTLVAAVAERLGYPAAAPEVPDVRVAMAGSGGRTRSPGLLASARLIASRLLKPTTAGT
jgi:hypothetical protein